MLSCVDARSLRLARQRQDFLVQRSTRNRLLVATPPLEDPNFDRTVVYMLEHSERGALGVVLNRPTAEHTIPGLEAWCDRSSEPAVVFSGGPVDEDALIGVAALVDGVPSDSWSPISEAIGTVDLGVAPDSLGVPLAHIRVFRGYSGWGSGQLEDELDQGAWMVLDAVPEDVFCREPEHLWRVVLRRQGGRLAWIADAPDDLSAN